MEESPPAIVAPPIEITRPRPAAMSIDIARDYCGQISLGHLRNYGPKARKIGRQNVWLKEHLDGWLMSLSGALEDRVPRSPKPWLNSTRLGDLWA